MTFSVPHDHYGHVTVRDLKPGNRETRPDGSGSDGGGACAWGDMFLV